MKCVVKNNSSMDMGPLLPLLKSLLPYTRKKLGFNRPPSLFFASDTENASKPLGKTAFYDPAEVSITIFVDGRHPKDILRSISHELVHHMQHERGDFGTDMATEEGYAQKNDALRELEREAYESGNMCFRDWEDENKQALQEAKQHFDRKNKKMSVLDKRNDKIESLLMEKWGLKNKTEKGNKKEEPVVRIADKKGNSEDIIRNIIKESFIRAKSTAYLIKEQEGRYYPEETRAEYSNLIDPGEDPDFDFTRDAEPFLRGVSLSEKVNTMSDQIKNGRMEGGEDTAGWNELLKDYANSGDPLKREIAIRSLIYNREKKTYQTSRTNSEGFNLEWMMRAKYKDANGDEKYIFNDIEDFLSLERGEETDGLQTLLKGLDLSSDQGAKKNAMDAMARYNLTDTGENIQLPVSSDEYKKWKSGGWGAAFGFDAGLVGALQSLETGEYEGGRTWEELTTAEKSLEKESARAAYIEENPLPAMELVRTTGSNVYKFVDPDAWFERGDDEMYATQKLLNRKYNQMTAENPGLKDALTIEAFYGYYNDFVKGEIESDRGRGQDLSRIIKTGATEAKMRTSDPVNSDQVHRHKTDSTGFESLFSNEETRDIFMPPDTTRASLDWVESKRQEFVSLKTGEDIANFINQAKIEREAPDFNDNLKVTNDNYAFDAAASKAAAAGVKAAAEAAEEAAEGLQEALIRKVVQEALKRKFGE
jgi:hypothetical protein